MPFNQYLNMAAVSNNILVFETNSQATIFSNNKILLLHSITNEVFPVKTIYCDAMGIYVRMCHISLPDDGIGRAVVILDRGLKAEAFSTPRVLAVDSSCILQGRYCSFCFTVRTEGFQITTMKLICN